MSAAISSVDDPMVAQSDLPECPRRFLARWTVDLSRFLFTILIAGPWFISGVLTVPQKSSNLSATCPARIKPTGDSNAANHAWGFCIRQSEMHLRPFDVEISSPLRYIHSRCFTGAIFVEAETTSAF